MIQPFWDIEQKQPKAVDGLRIAVTRALGVPVALDQVVAVFMFLY